MRLFMTPFEREYFISRLRCGFYLVNVGGLEVKIVTPRIEDDFFANKIFMKSYEEAVDDGIMTEEEMLAWMKDTGIWSDEKENKIKGINKDIEKLKVEIFQNRNKADVRNRIRKYLRAAEAALSKLQDEKNHYFSKTCEGLAFEDKTLATFSRCCYINGERVDFEFIDINTLFYEYSKQILKENQLRELARNDPWRLLWRMKDETKLFANEVGRELSNDQKGIIIWSNMYDNIQESVDCPTEDVINDDDMLDGWFIIQRKKNESERAKSELEQKTQNSKIANSDEILIMASSRDDAENIHSMNSVHGETIRKQRLNTVRKKGKAQDTDFQDRQLEIRNQAQQAFKQKTRR